jgi:hypothetical protein
LINRHSGMKVMAAAYWNSPRKEPGCSGIFRFNASVSASAGGADRQTPL